MYQSRIGQQRARIVSSYWRLHEKATGRETVEIEFVDDLIRGFIVAGFAAGFAIHQAVGTNTDVDYGLAEAAELFAFAGAFCTFALHASILRGTGSGAHAARLARAERQENVTEVMKVTLSLLARGIGSRISIQAIQQFPTAVSTLLYGRGLTTQGCC